LGSFVAELLGERRDVVEKVEDEYVAEEDTISLTLAALALEGLEL
jgi:hypothetical protein